MAQPTDLTGMLTAGLFEPTQQALPSSLEQVSMRLAQQAGIGLRRGIGAATGADTRTNPEVARAAMQGLDINNPADQPKILQIVRKYAPEREAALVAQFAQQGRQRSLLEAAATKEAAEAVREEKKYQEGLALEKRRVKATETSSLSSLLKAQTPSTSIVKGENGDYTVVEDNTGVVISRGSTLSEAQKVAKELAPFQERQATKKVALNKIQEVETTMRRAEELMGISRYSQNSPEALENPKLIGEIMPSSLPGTGSDYWAKMVENVPVLDAIGDFEITKLESEIKTLKSGLALDALAVLKKLSSTGASGLGATNAMEIEMLQNELVTLDATLPSDLPRKFDIIRKHMNTLLNISNDLPVEIEWSNPKYGKYTREFEGIRAYTLDNGRTFYNQVNNQLIPE